MPNAPFVARRSVVGGVVAVAIVIVGARVASAHFPVLLMDRPWAKKGDAVLIDYRFGHPFEASYIDVAAPERIGVLPPEGECIVLGEKVEEMAFGDGAAKARGWRVRYVPEERGDHIVHLTAAPVVHEGKAFIDLVKTVLHVQAQRGWDASVDHPLEIVPLTRPYGLAPGASFRARVLRAGAPLAGAEVAVERRNVRPPEPLPPDEMITRVEKTDAGGAFAATLDAPGWWVVAVEADAGTKVQIEKESLPAVHRASLWVFVGAPGE